MGASFTFNGTNSVLDYGDLGMYDGLTAFTNSFWVNSASFSGNGGYFDKYNGYGNNDSVSLMYDSSTTHIEFAIWGPSAATKQNGNCTHGMSTDTWYHIVWTWDASRNSTDAGFELYINGIKKTLFGTTNEGTATLNSGSANVVIGAAYNWVLWKNGKFAYVRAFNRAITGDEANELYKKINSISRGLIFEADLLDSAGKEIFTQTNPTIIGSAAPSQDGPPVFFPTMLN
jgi:hypothetical protein